MLYTITNSDAISFFTKRGFWKQTIKAIFIYVLIFYFQLNHYQLDYLVKTALCLLAQR